MQVRAPTPRPIGVGAAAAALTTLALVLPASAEAAPRLRTVEDVQARLAELGYLPRSGVDGVYGEQTRSAVLAFQKSELLPRTGVAGRVTRSVLAEAERPRPFTSAGGRRVEIVLDRQVLLLIRKGRVVRTVHVSTGKRGFRTPAGTYRILRKVRRSWSVPYEVWLPWASYFVGGIAIHQSRNVPARPASHGCVRVTRFDARWLFRRTPVGTPVRVLTRT